MLEYQEELKQKISNIEVEIEAIKHSFQSTNEVQRDSFKPFAIFFSSPDKKELAITSRPVADVNDYYTAISEMMFAYSSTSSQSVLFAIDANKDIDGVPQDLLEIYMACDDFCTVFTFPYFFTEDNKFQWNTDLSNIYTLEKLEKAYDTNGHFHATLEIFELLYLHTHIEEEYFDILKIKSFFDLNNFTYIHLNESDLTKSSASL